MEDDVDEESFRRIHAVCTRLLDQNCPEPLSKRVKELTAVLQDVDAPQLQSIHLAVTYPLRLLLRRPNLSDSDYKAVLDSLANLFDRCRIEQWSSIRDLLTQILFVMSQHDKELVLAPALRCIHSLCVEIQENTTLADECYNEENLPALGHRTSVLLHVLKNENGAQGLDTRRLAAQCLLLSVSPRSHALPSISENHGIAGTVASILPGILLGAVQCAIADYTTNHNLVVDCLQLCAQTVCLVMNDVEYDYCCGNEENPPSAKKGLRVAQTKEWFATTANNIQKLLKTLCSRLAKADSSTVREALLRLLLRLTTECERALSEAIDGCVIDCAVLLRNDAYASVCASAERVLNAIKSSPTERSQRLRTKLTGAAFDLCTRLPTLVRAQSSDGGRLALDQLIGVLTTLGSDGIQLFGLSSAHMQRLLTSLVQIIHFDYGRLAISSSTDNGTTEFDVLKRLPLKFQLDGSQISGVIELLYRHADHAVLFDYLLEGFESSSSTELAYAYLLCCALKSAGKEISSQDHTLIHDASRSCVGRLQTLQLDLLPVDSAIRDTSLATGRDSVLACLLLSAIAQCALVLTTDSTVLLELTLDCLYAVLERVATGQWLVRETALASLRSIAIANCLPDACDLLLAHGDFLVHSVGVRMRQMDENRRAPLVLAAALDLCESAEMYGHVKEMVGELLLAVDTHHERWCLLMLRALLSFVNAIGRWFSHLTPDPKQDDVIADDDDVSVSTSADQLSPVDTPKSPQPIVDVVAVLNRTKHLISFSHLPLRLVVLDIVDAGLRAVRQFENDLLPMIHQNWSGLLRRFDDTELIVRSKALSVVATMAEVSGTFVYRRIIDELWPKLERFMVSQATLSADTGQVYEHSAAFKYQKIFFAKIASIFDDIKANSTDIHRLRTVAELYSNDSRQPNELIQTASFVLQRFSEVT
uniref:TELO2 interacting protein 1 n=1 Tax=Plectus sambesii TaxID=2011161 RepID=A0A914V3N6_9BILA